MRHLYVLILCLLPLGPAAEASSITFPTTSLDIKTQQTTLHYTVEVATTDKQHSHGLMYRKQLPQMHGMVFVFSDIHPVSFWMKNTPLPLDILFVDGKGVITGIAADAVPETTTPINSPGAVRAVIEVAGGSAKRYHIASGDKVITSVIP